MRGRMCIYSKNVLTVIASIVCWEFLLVISLHWWITHIFIVLRELLHVFIYCVCMCVHNDWIGLFFIQQKQLTRDIATCPTTHHA